MIRVGPNSLSFSSLAGYDAIYGYNKSIEKGDLYDFARDTKTQAENIFTARTDASHREHRKKVVGPALSTTKVASYQPVIEKHVSFLQSRLVDALSLDAKLGTVDIAPLIHRFTFDTLNDIIYGEPLSPEPYTNLPASSGVLKDIRKVAKLSWGCSLVPWLGRLMSSRSVAVRTRKPTYDEDGKLTSIAALTAQTRDLILEHPERALETAPPSILKSWLQVPDGSSTRMDRNEMWREAYNLTFAGPGSTSAALTSILIELGTAEGQHWQERIRNELKDGTPPGSSPALTAVIKETLRLHAPFPTSFPRTIAPGAENALIDVAGPLPVGTTISANTFVLGQSKEIWGEDARVWKPQRWLDGSSETKDLDDKFVVFSKGPRACIGRDIVYLMLAAALPSLLQKWKVRFEGEVEARNFLEMQYMTCRMNFSKIKE